MRFGVHLPNMRGYLPFSNIRKIAELAEELGFHALWTSDHLQYPHPYRILGEPGLYESTSVLSYLAGVTSRVTIGSSVLLPLRHPLLLTSMITTIDHASNGRIQMGYGVGWYKPEFANLDLPFSKRGRLASEQLKIMQLLWTQPLVTFSGEFYSLKNAEVVPRPVQKPHPPILIGGSSSKAFERAVEFGSGWMPFSPTLNQMKLGIEEIKRIASERKRNLDAFLFYADFQTAIARTKEDARKGASLIAALRDSTVEELEPSCLIGDPSTIAKRIEEFLSLGVQQISLEIEPVDSILESVKLFAKEVAPSF
ncbi:MAG: LLM class flavin-dependent oxidoreductase [Thaumarchaeota archaeon]|nr:LLM class flavin-dependent oxidoreductase [Nitrososphaerota archaeon]